MSLFKFFRATKTYGEDMQREKDCVARIKQTVSKRCGGSDFMKIKLLENALEILWDKLNFDFPVASFSDALSALKAHAGNVLIMSEDKTTDWDFDENNPMKQAKTRYCMIAHNRLREVPAYV